MSNRAYSEIELLRDCGVRVFAWVDQSGQGHHLLQSDVAKAPGLASPAAFNSKRHDDLARGTCNNQGENMSNRTYVEIELLRDCGVRVGGRVGAEQLLAFRQDGGWTITREDAVMTIRHAEHGAFDLPMSSVRSARHGGSK